MFQSAAVFPNLRKFGESIYFNPLFFNAFEVMVFYIFVTHGKQTENGKTQSTGS